MKCRFDPEHTQEFANAVMLQKHYVAEHADVYVPPVKRPCPVPDCGKSVSDLTQHLRKKHGISGVPSQAIVTVETPEPVAPTWTADHIVLPVVTELAGGKKGSIPVNKLGAVFAWRDATQAMLDQVQ